MKYDLGRVHGSPPHTKVDPRWPPATARSQKSTLNAATVSLRVFLNRMPMPCCLNRRNYSISNLTLEFQGRETLSALEAVLASVGRAGDAVIIYTLSPGGAFSVISYRIAVILWPWVIHRKSNWRYWDQSTHYVEASIRSRLFPKGEASAN